MKRKTFSAFVGIKHIVGKIGAHNVLAKPLRPSCFARVVVKFLVGRQSRTQRVGRLVGRKVELYLTYTSFKGVNRS